MSGGRLLRRSPLFSVPSVLKLFRTRRQTFNTEHTEKKTREPQSLQATLSVYGLRVGRMWTSLMKLPADCVTSAATACATSSGCKDFSGFFFDCPPNSVATEPGQIVLTRIPYPRRSSAMLPESPINPHFDAQ